MPKGFTLIELIIVVAIITLLAAASFIAINPSRRMGQANDSQRWLDITALVKAIDEYTADNGQLPADFSDYIEEGSKLVLCSQAASLSCDGQTKDCLVVDDTNFLGAYLPSLPIDPNKSASTDTGYYITRKSGDLVSIGACESYGETNDLEIKGSTKLTPFICGVHEVTANGLSYGTVMALDGRCWLNKNLGASQVATAYNDSLAYGDLYQWGRYSDGHQLRTSNTTDTLSSSDTPGHGNWITIGSSPYDWRNPQNNNLWQGVDGANNPCPNGWRLPSSAELSGLFSAENITNSATAYSSRLKFVVSGRRDESGNISLAGSWGYYWSSSVSGTNASMYTFSGSSVAPFAGGRARGSSVRCLKN